MTDRCCRECKSSFPDVCHKRRDCFCHLEQRLVWHEPTNPPHRDPVGERVANKDLAQRRKRGRRKER